MKALRRFRRRRWLVTVACVAVAVPVGITASTAPAGGKAVAGHATITVNADYLYSQLYAMSKDFSYRVSGADGDPRNAADPFNLPPTVNGWQELIAYWKHALTDPSADTSLAAFATASDHYFRRSGGYRFDSNDAEVTLPGATCAGQRVMVAAHPDETPVPSDVAALIDSGTTSGTTGFGAARRHITDSNLGNEGAYDGLSGVAVTMAEYNALLRWYDANRTYPKRTLKVTLLDASRGKTATGLFSREGSAYYADNLIPTGPQGQTILFANMDSLGLDYPPPGHRVLLEQRHRRRCRAVVHLHQGHAGRPERGLPRHRFRLARREHHGQLRGDRAVAHRPAVGRLDRIRAAGEQVQLLGAVGESAALQPDRPGAEPVQRRGTDQARVLSGGAGAVLADPRRR